MTRGLVLVLLAALLPVEVRGERTFGLVVGIDDYTYITDLHGAGVGLVRGRAPTPAAR